MLFPVKQPSPRSSENNSCKKFQHKLTLHFLHNFVPVFCILSSHLPPLRTNKNIINVKFSLIFLNPIRKSLCEKKPLFTVVLA